MQYRSVDLPSSQMVAGVVTPRLLGSDGGMRFFVDVNIVTHRVTMFTRVDTSAPLRGVLVLN